jgi:hypothetical protein
MEITPLPALWGVLSNGEFGPGIDVGLAFSTGLGRRRLTISSGAFATLMRPSMANAQQGEPMLETYFSAPKTLRRLRGGISGPHIDAFADDLEREGYAPASAVQLAPRPPGSSRRPGGLSPDLLRTCAVAAHLQSLGSPGEYGAKILLVACCSQEVPGQDLGTLSVATFSVSAMISSVDSVIAFTQRRRFAHGGVAESACATHRVRHRARSGAAY